MPKTRMFISYSHHDEVLLDELKTHLATLQREELLDVWTDRRILPGDRWEAEIDGQLEDAQIVLLLISADFIASRYCYEVEMGRALVRQGEGTVRVIPVILRPCDWLTMAFGNLGALPKDGKAVTEWENRDRAWLDVVQGLRRVLSTGGGGPTSRRLGSTVHNLPFPSLGDLFKGRDKELTDLDKGDAVAITAVPHTIHGLGGMGKTRLAVEFAWRQLARYRAALFVVAESPERLRAELAALAGPEVLALLDWEQKGATQQQVVHVVLDWLRNNKGWLLIFDNVDNQDAAAEVEVLLPQLTGGHVLITSRLTTWGGGIHRTALDTLPLAEARAFLLARLGRSGEENEALAGELAEELGRLPLALEQAAAYMDKQRRSFSKYLAEWKEQRAKVLSWHDARLMKYPAPVATTWETTFGLLSPAARTVLRLVAHLAPEPLAVAMFEEGAEIVAEACAALAGEEVEGLDLGDTLAELTEYSMITLEVETFTVHRLVQEVTRGRIEEGRGEAWVVWALRLVYGYAPGKPSDVRTWPVWDPLRPHAGRVLEHAGKVGNPEPASALMSQLALLLKAKALATEAEPLLRRALQIDEKSYGVQHPTVARDLNNLALLLQVTNRLSEAEPLLHRALQIAEESYGSQHPNVAAALNNLALLLKATNRLFEAESLLRRALQIDEVSYGAQHPNVAIALNNLARLLQATNRLGEAEPLLRRALQIDEASYGLQHPEVATDLNNLALLLQAMDRLSEAEPLMRRALEIVTASLGSEHPYAQKSQANLDQLVHEMSEARTS